MDRRKRAPTPCGWSPQRPYQWDKILLSIFISPPICIIIQIISTIRGLLFVKLLKGLGNNYFINANRIFYFIPTSYYEVQCKGDKIQQGSLSLKDLATNTKQNSFFHLKKNVPVSMVMFGISASIMKGLWKGITEVAAGPRGITLARCILLSAQTVT